MSQDTDQIESMNEVVTEEEQQALINAANAKGYDVLTSHVWLYDRNGTGEGVMYESREAALDFLLGQ